MPTITDSSPITLSRWNERVAPYLAITDEGCWEWQRARTPNGYGKIHINRSLQYVHRLSHEVWVGPLVDGLEVDHLCVNPPCANPAHLEAVTRRVNTLRSRNFTAEQARQTHCIHGHPFNQANTYIAPNGSRNCRECRKRVKRESYARRNAA